MSGTITITVKNTTISVHDWALRDMVANADLPTIRLDAGATSDTMTLTANDVGEGSLNWKIADPNYNADWTNTPFVQGGSTVNLY